MDFTKSFWVRSCETGRRGVCTSVVVLGVLILSTLLAYSAFGPVKDRRGIVQVAIIFRHGDRTPSETYHNDPYAKYAWEDGWGALTKKGMKQLYNFGWWIREEYDGIIDSKFHSSNAFIQSSYADRCIMSAQALLAALYHPEPQDYFIDELPWRPVPVHSIPRNMDKLITVKYPCPKLEYALKEAYINESVKNGKKMASYFDKLSFHTGQNISTITDVEFLYNTLEIEDKNGLKLPGWTKQFYNEAMREIAARSLAIFTSNPIQRRLRGGPLLKQIVYNMVQARNELDKTKLYLYSAHDITLVNVLRTMGYTDQLFKPDYGAALIFELYSAEYKDEMDLKLHVKVKYMNNTEMSAPTLLEIPGCKQPCKLFDLLDIWKDILPTDWDAECIS